MKGLFGRFLPIQHFSPSDRTLSWLMWALGICQGYVQATLASVLPFVRRAFELTEGQMSGLIALTRVGTLLALPFGLLADRRGRRGAFRIAYLVLVVAGPATALVGGPEGFVVTQSLVRAATAAVSSLGVVLIVELISPRVRAYGVALYGAGGSLGAGLALLSLNLADGPIEAWRTPFWLGIAALALLPWLSRTLSESRFFDPRQHLPFRLLIYGHLARHFWLTGAAFFLASVFSTVALTFSTERLVNDLGFTTAGAVAVSLLGGGVGGTGFFIGGRLADQWGRRWATVFAIALAVLGGVGLYWFSNPVLVTLAITVGSFGSFAYVPASSTHRAELFPTELRSTAQTGAANLAMLGSAAGLGLATLLIDRVGLLATIGWLAIAAGGAIVCTLALPETKGRDLAAVS